MRSLRGEGRRRRLQGFTALILGGLFLEILGCALVSDSPPIAPEGVPSRRRDLAELLQGLAQRGRELRSLRTLAQVSYRGRDGRGGFQEAILVRRPDRLRLETLTPFGALLIITVDGHEVLGFHPREALFYRGRSSKENILRYTRIPLEVVELTSLLMGLPPVEIQDHWQAKGDAIQRDLKGGGREVVSFDPLQAIPIRWERSGPDGRIELSAHFSDFSPTPAGPFPLAISLEDRSLGNRLEIRYQEPEVNVDLPSGLFIQEKPANAKEVLLESLGG